MTNFDFLLEEKELSKIAKVAIDAEKIATISCRQSIMAARSAAEFAVKWFYAYNPRGLIMPTKATFAELLNNTEEIIDHRTNRCNSCFNQINFWPEQEEPSC